MTWLDFIALGLASWRVSVLVTSESGPFGVMLRIRELFDVEHNEDGEITVAPVSGTGKLLTCVWCFSFWAVVWLGFVGTTFPWAIHALGAWALACIIHGLVMRE